MDEYRFLDPWTRMLPPGGGVVLAVAGAGGKSELLRRLYAHYRAEGFSVLWTQTVAHPPPDELECVADPSDPESLRTRLADRGALFVAGAPDADGTWAGLAPERIELLRSVLAPDVVIVECHQATGCLLRRDGIAPVWPLAPTLAFIVAAIGAVGRLRDPRSVAGIDVPPRAAGEEPARVSLDDALHLMRGDDNLLDDAPASALPVPFFTRFGEYRDIDGMFTLVDELVVHPRARVVCLAELKGDPRRDEADLRGLDEGGPAAAALAGERVYAVYPAESDED